MDVIWSVLQILCQDSKARPTVLPSPKDGSFGPISPEDVLLEDSHGIWVHDPMQYYLSVLTSQSGPLNFISVRRRELKKNNTVLSPIYKNPVHTEKHQPSRASSLHSL